MALGMIALVYACGDNTENPVRMVGGSGGGPGFAGSSGGAAGSSAVSGGSVSGGSAAANGGAPNVGGNGRAGDGGQAPIPIYEQDDPALVPAETAFQRLRVPVSVNKAMQIDIDQDENVYILERDGAVRIWKASGQVVEAGQLDTFSCNEDGALGFALDPHYADNHYVYIY